MKNCSQKKFKKIFYIRNLDRLMTVSDSGEKKSEKKKESKRKNVW